MVEDFKGYREKNAEKPRTTGLSILVVSHMAVLFVGIVLGYWIGGHFVAAPMLRDTASKKGETQESVSAPSGDEPKPPAQGGEQVATGDADLGYSDAPVEEPRFTFYESLSKQTDSESDRTMAEGGKTKDGHSAGLGLKAPESKVQQKESVGGGRSFVVYYVQVASFRQVERAEMLRDRLRDKGYGAEVASARLENKEIWHRVRLGPFEDKALADEKVREVAKTEKLEAMVFAEGKNKTP